MRLALKIVSGISATVALNFFILGWFVPGNGELEGFITAAAILVAAIAFLLAHSHPAQQIPS